MPPGVVPPFVARGGRKKRGARRGYMPPGHQPGARPTINPGDQYTVPPTIQPGAQYQVPPDVKLGSAVPIKDLPPWMPRATFFPKRDPLDRGAGP